MAKKPDWKLHPETAMMGLGFEPEWSEGALDCPVFRSTNYEAVSAEKTEKNFEHPAAESTLVYSRLNHPNSQILEERLAYWEGAELGAVFSSGMAAIFALCFEFLNPKDILLCSEPMYSATATLFKDILPRKLGIETIGFNPQNMRDKILKALLRSDKQVRMVFIETPANPTNEIFDIELCRKTLAGLKIIIAIDNTFLGPVFQHPLEHGADISVYSATKFIGGHGDVVAGACVGRKEYIERLKKSRMYLGSSLSPDSAWLLARSLKTLGQRVKHQTLNAQAVAQYLAGHKKVSKVYYLGLIKKDSSDFQVYKKQCLGPGAVVSFDIKGKDGEALEFLNALTVFKRAVSLGGTESLAQRPYTMTHAGISPEEKERLGITKKMIRLSIGGEHPQDLIQDLRQALDKI